MDSLASGRVVVHNGDKAIYDGRATWRVNERTTIGSDSGDGPLGEVWDLAVDDHGTIYASLPRQEEIRAFGPDGSSLRRIRTSAGGSLRTFPVKLALDSTQRLWVLDSPNARYLVYDTTGQLVETVPLPNARIGYCRPVACGWFDRRGNLVDGTLGFRADTSPAIVVTVSGPDHPSPARFSFVLERSIGIFAFVPYGDRTGYAFDPDGFLWLGSPRKYVLEKMAVSPPFDTVLTTSREYSRRSLNETERGHLQSLRSRLERSLGESVAAARVPDVAPAFTSLVVDDRGRLWVARYGSTDGVTRDFDIFDAQGRFLARATTDFDVKVNPASQAPYSFTPILIRGADFYALRSEGPGQDYVVHAAIRGLP